MIRILQQDNRIVKGVFVVIIVVAIGAMTVALVPGIFDNGVTQDATVYATVRNPGLLGKIDGDSITVRTEDVQRAAQQMLQQNGLPAQYLSLVMGRAGQQEIERKVLGKEADRLGLAVSDEDLKRYLQNGPYSQYIFPDGKYIGDDKYISFVESVFQLPITQFETLVKSELELQRLEALVTGGVTVSDAAVRANYLQSGTKVKFDYAVVSSTDLRATINPTDAELQEFFKKNAARYATAVPEERKLAFFSFDNFNIPGGTPPVSDADVQAYYNAHQADYKTPEQVKTRHILITVPKGADAKTDAAAKAKADDLLKQIKGGANFAELAKKNSEDPGSKDQGGELPMMATSGLDPAYAKAAMALAPGQTSPVVRSSFGYHIIQTEAKDAGGTKTLADVKPAIVEQLSTQKAAAAAQNYAAALVAEAKKNGLDKTAAAHHLQLTTTDYLGKTGSIPSLPDSTSLLNAAFDAKKGDAPQTASTGEGYAIFQVVDIKPAHAPEFAAYKDHILEDYRAEKTPELLNAQLIKLADRAKALGDLHKAAEEMKLAVKSSDLVGRDAQVPDIGALTGAASVVFTLPKGGISGPVNEGVNGAVLQLTDKVEPTPQEIAANFEATKEKLLNQQRQEAFSVFISSLMDRYEKAGAITYSRKQTGPTLPFGN
jgi:peptidyl-prolyl cis-trans isomerase D